MKKSSLIDNSSGIYCIVNLINGKMYVGSANNLFKRKGTHSSRLRSNKHHSIKLQNAYNKYKEENFVFDLIEFVSDKSKLIEAEQKWVDFFNPEYNICKKIVNTRFGVKLSDESKKKISLAQVGRVISEQTRMNMKESAKKLIGVPRTEEVKRKISISNTGKKRTEEQNKKSSEVGKKRIMKPEHLEKLMQNLSFGRAWNKGKKMSVEARKNMSIAQKGRVSTESQRAKISLALKGRKRTEQAKENSRKARSPYGCSARLILNTDNGIFYDSIKTAWKAYGKNIALANFGRKIKGTERNYTPFIYA